MEMVDINEERYDRARKDIAALETDLFDHRTSYNQLKAEFWALYVRHERLERRVRKGILSLSFAIAGLILTCGAVIVSILNNG